MDGWGGTRLTSHDSLSVSANIDGQDVISVEWLFRVLVLGTHLRRFTTIERLLASVSVHDNTQSSNHVYGFAFGRVPQILLAICCAVAVDMLDLKFSLGGRWIRLCQ